MVLPPLGGNLAEKHGRKWKREMPDNRPIMDFGQHESMDTLLLFKQA